MTEKILGAFLVVLSCTAAGYSLAAACKREMRCLQQLILALEYMQNELQFRMPPLPELCHMTASRCSGIIQTVMEALALELDGSLAPEAEYCMETVIRGMPQIPAVTKKMLHLFGQSMGRFDLQGQISGMVAVQQMCRRELDVLHASQELRLRSYRTLGICAGLGLAILLI